MDNKCKSVESFDRSLHRSLTNIFGGLTSDQIKEFLSRPELAHKNTKIKLAMKQERVLSGSPFSKRELGKLSLLWITILGGYKESAELLITSGADVNEPFGRHDPQAIHKNSTVLHFLVQKYFSSEDDRLIRLVLDHGADLQARAANDRSVLYYALSHGAKMTEILLEKGADTSVADVYGKTPLLVAASKGKAVELVQLFMKYGADVTAKDSENRNILHYLGFSVSNLFEDNVDLPRALIERGVSVNDKDISFEYQPLHTAAFVGKNNLAKLFLDYGANVNEQTRDGETALCLAVRYSNNPDLTETLISRGADLFLGETNGRTALHSACLSQFVSNAEKHVEILLDAGADVLAEDHEGNTPLALIDSIENRSFNLLIQKLALKKALQPALELKDQEIIERNPEMSSCYQQCMEEIDRMRLVRLTNKCTLLDILVKRYYEIGPLMRNPQLERQFGLCDWSKFPTYSDELSRALKRAKEFYRLMLKQEDLINEALDYAAPLENVWRAVELLGVDCELVAEM